MLWLVGYFYSAHTYILHLLLRYVVGATGSDAVEVVSKLLELPGDRLSSTKLDFQPQQQHDGLLKSQQIKSVSNQIENSLDGQGPNKSGMGEDWGD